MGNVVPITQAPTSAPDFAKNAPPGQVSQPTLIKEAYGLQARQAMQQSDFCFISQSEGNSNTLRPSAEWLMEQAKIQMDMARCFAAAGRYNVIPMPERQEAVDYDLPSVVNG